MTRNSDFKRRVRERMAKTGERYTAARRQLLLTEAGSAPAQPPDTRGIDAATTAFRLLLEHANVWLDERQLLLAGGGIGIGVFTFSYPDFSTLFIAGRHLWHDDLAYLQGLAERIGVSLEVRETGSRKRAASDLLELLEQGPVIAFVDLATLGHRGGLEAYYVVTVLEADGMSGMARIADLADRPIEVPLALLADARARHKKFRNRLLRLRSAEGVSATRQAIQAGLRACADGLVESPMKGFGSNFTLDSLGLLAGRMRGKGKESWQQVFPPGPRLWNALRSLYEYVEHYGSGGGLLRPLFAAALEAEYGASAAGSAYSELGGSWSRLARTALDPEVSEFDRLARLIDESYGVYDALGPDSTAELQRLRRQIGEVMELPFPLSAADSQRLLERLAGQVEELEAGERSAREELARLGG